MNLANTKPKCKKHGTPLYYNPDDGYNCNACERDMWDNEANHTIRGFKCPVCLRPTILEEYDEGYVAFRCKDIFDSDGNYAKDPCPIFMVKVCVTCNQASCVCEEYPEQPEREY